MKTNFKSFGQRIAEELENSIEVKKRVIDEQLSTLNDIATLSIQTIQEGKKIILFGNGGSAADAQHIAAELVNMFSRDRRALPAIALTTDSSILTCIANDRSFEDVFSRQIEAIGQKGDMAIGISTSGNSPNVLKAIRTAKERGIMTVGFTGADGGKLKDYANICFRVPSRATPRIQEVHITVAHAICGLIEEELFPNNVYPGVFLDRDGTINEEVSYLADISQLKLIDGTPEAIGLLKKSNFKVVVFTNQAAVAKGYLSEKALQGIHHRMEDMLRAQNARIDAIYYCPHRPTEGIAPYNVDCSCRKPKPGMLERASRDLRIDLTKSFVVGDKMTDLEAGYAVGCRGILVRTGYGRESEKQVITHNFQPDYVAANLLEASQWILKRSA